MKLFLCGRLGMRAKIGYNLASNSGLFAIHSRTRGMCLMGSPQLQTVQSFLNGEIHEWYRIALGFTDQVVAHVLDGFDLRPDQRVLDPFCGTGTTLVECMKRGIPCTGIDANPSSVFAARVKTNWGLEGERLIQLLRDVDGHYRKSLLSADHTHDSTYRYIVSSGMLERGWISPEPLRKAILIKMSISSLSAWPEYRDCLMLALISEVLRGASNVKFGPELYCAQRKQDADVFQGFHDRVIIMAHDLDTVSALVAPAVNVVRGDSRDCETAVKQIAPGPYSAIICSPPYPGEHDYTRNARLELAFLEEVFDRASLQSIKRTMLRSNTKGYYKGDNDAAWIEGNSQIAELTEELSEKVYCS
jgi:hypothetical protein